MTRVAVFDLDGTLADTAADLIAAANAALADLGFAGCLDASSDRATAFAGGRAMLRAGLAAQGVAEPGNLIESGFPKLLSHYEAGIAERTRLYPGVEPALDRLTARGWALAICTNKPVVLADLLLIRLGIRERFAAVLGADSLAVRKPDPLHLTETVLRAGGTPGRAVLVGDTTTDREAARAADIPCVLVGFGPEGRGISRLDPAGLIDDYAELPPLLERLVPPV